MIDNKLKFHSNGYFGMPILQYAKYKSQRNRNTRVVNNAATKAQTRVHV